MAKELSMVESNEKGSQSRKYFIDIDNKYKEQQKQSYIMPKTYKEALLQLIAEEEEKEKLQLENKQKDQLIGGTGNMMCS